MQSVAKLIFNFYFYFNQLAIINKSTDYLNLTNIDLKLM